MLSSVNDVVALEVDSVLEFVPEDGCCVVNHSSVVVLEVMVDVLLSLIGCFIVVPVEGTVLGIAVKATVDFVLYVPFVVLAELAGAVGEI